MKNYDTVSAVEDVPTKGYVDLIAVPIGAIMPFASITPPTNFLLCQGQAVNRTTYSALFTVCGVSYGIGDGSTTFNLPNLMGRVPVGRDTGIADFDTVGEQGGLQRVTLTTAEMPAHNHPIANGAAEMVSNGPSGTSYAVQSGSSYGFRGSNIGVTGAGGSHQNMPPYVVIPYIIRAL